MYESSLHTDVVSHRLTSFQQQTWRVYSQSSPDIALNTCRRFSLEGHLDTELLRQAVQEISTRYTTLHGRYERDALGEVRCEAVGPRPAFFVEHDLTDLPEQSRIYRREVLLRRESGYHFDLAHDALLRVSVLRLAASKYEVLFVAHRLIWDEQSWDVWIADLNEWHSGNTTAEETENYAAVVQSWEHSAENNFSNKLEYWRATLELPPEPLVIPGSNGREEKVATSSGFYSTPLTAAVHDAVERTSTTLECSLETIYLAAISAVIWRYAHATDFLIAVPARTQEERNSAHVAGNFDTAIPLRQQISHKESFATLVQKTEDNYRQARAQSVSIPHLEQAMTEYSCVKQENGQLTFMPSVGCAVRTERTEWETARFGRTEQGCSTLVGSRRDFYASPERAVQLSVEHHSSGSTIVVHYHKGLVHASLAREIVQATVVFLEQAVQTPEKPLGAFSLLEKKTHDAILKHSRGTAEDNGPEFLMTMLEQQVADSPEAIALISDDTTLTYTQMNGRANRLAHYLIAQGYGSEDVIAVMMANSVECVVAILAALKAGCAYVPIDPGFPESRKEHMLCDAQPILVLNAESAEKYERAALDFPDTNPTNDDRVRPLTTANLAYVLYTSGSTGTPKGVAVAHEAIADYIGGIARSQWMESEDRVLMLTSVSFDASLFDIFVTFSVGARLVIPPSGGKNFIEVVRLMQQEAITIMHMVPSMLQMLIAIPDVGQWRTIRKVPVGGEILSGDVAEKFAAIADATLDNFYGPTEAVLAATKHTSIQGKEHGPVALPIGLPIRNNAVYVLDDALGTVPQGVVGEVYLGGPQLARGYWANAGLTAERFIADPFSPGGRLYRTGDMARWNDSGEMEFIGRRDDQVKIRGVRIELGEVAAAVSAHPGVEHCVVIAQDLPGLGKSLVAYVVARGARIDCAQVRAQVATVLPGSMAPAAYVVIDHIPLTMQGKLDRHALPMPEIRSELLHRAPETETEERLCALFSWLVGQDHVGIDDSFFDMGGHSLLATRLVAQIRAEFDVELAARAPFDAPTVAELAEVIDAARFASQAHVSIVGSAL